MGKILIKNGRIWNGSRFFFGDVLTDDGIISKIAPRLDENADFVYDAKGETVSPGMVDAHVHMKHISGDRFGFSAEMGTLPFGVTAAADASADFGDRKLLDLFDVKSVVFVCAGFKNNRAYFENAKEKLLHYGDKAVGIKVYFDIGLSEVSDISPLMEVIEFAEKNNLIVMVHSSNPPVSMAELLGALRKGDILTHAYHGGKNNVSEDNYECIRQAKKRGVIIDAGLAGHIHTDFKVFENAIACGAIPDIISTDITKFSAYQRGGKYGMTMCMSIAKTLGMKEEEIFRAVTSAPAAALGKGSKWGALEEGRCADIAVLSYSDEGFDLTDKEGNHIEDKKGYRCTLTIADGKVVYKI